MDDSSHLTRNFTSQKTVESSFRLLKREKKTKQKTKISVNLNFFLSQLFSKNSSKINTRSDKCKQINLTLKMKWIKELIYQSFPKKKQNICTVKQIAKGDLPCDLGNSDRDSDDLEGGDGEGDRREVRVGGDVGVPMADSCGCTKRTTKFCKANILN